MIKPLKESKGSANFNLEEVLNVMGWSDSGIATNVEALQFILTNYYN